MVKELLDNSIDAGSTSVRVDIERGGSKLIRVKDNGQGMNRDDCLLSIERHTTSKLRSETELVSIATKGFRGEALASIASVSQLSLLSYDGVSEEGTKVYVEGGSIRNVEPIGMGRGTVVEVRNLFFDVPVRRKFLKSVKVEAGHIEELVSKVALAHPGVGFVYSEDAGSRWTRLPRDQRWSGYASSTLKTYATTWYASITLGRHQASGLRGKTSLHQVRRPIHHHFCQRKACPGPARYRGIKPCLCKFVGEGTVSVSYSISRGSAGQSRRERPSSKDRGPFHSPRGFLTQSCKG